MKWIVAQGKVTKHQASATARFLNLVQSWDKMGPMITCLLNRICHIEAELAGLLTGYLEGGDT